MGRARSTGTRGKTAQRMRGLSEKRLERERIRRLKRTLKQAKKQEQAGRQGGNWLTRPRQVRGVLVVETRPTGEDAIAYAKSTLRLGVIAYGVERAWMLSAPLIFLGLLLLGLHWLGFFAFLPAWQDEFGIRPLWLVIYLVLLAVVLWLTVPPWLARLRRNPPFKGLKRLVRRAYEGEERPLSALQDKPANKLSAYGEVLWQRERTRNLALLEKCHLRLPTFSLSKRDPYALRGLILIVFALGLVTQIADPQASRGDDGNPLVLSARFNLWLDPPAYTGQAPSLLPADLEMVKRNEVIAVPHGSRLTGRITSPPDREPPLLSIDGVAIATEADGEGSFAVDWLMDDPALHRVARLSLELPGRDFLWDVITIPDEAPEVSIRGPITETQRGSLDIAYQAQDDYGVTRVDLVLQRTGRDFSITDGLESGTTESQTQLSATTNQETSQEASEQPAAQAELQTEAIQEDQNTLRLQLFVTETGVPELADTAYPDLRAHPWAGFLVSAHLEAHDGGGNTSKSDSQNITLPELRFTHPLAQVLVALRKKLNDGLVQVPLVQNHLKKEIRKWRGEISTGNHLALLFAEARLASPTDLEKVRAVQDIFWAVARDLEEGEITSLEEKVRALMEQLREAIREGKSDEEIAALLEELRQQSMEYLRALREQAAARGLLGRRNRDGDGAGEGGGGQDPNDIFNEAQSLLDGGQRGDLMGLLDDLERLLANPQFAEGEGSGQGGNGTGAGEGDGEGTGERAFDEGRSLLDEQARILNETFRGRQDGSSGDPAVREGLGEAQRALRDGVGEYIRQGEQEAIESGGAGVSDQARQSLDEATGAMEEAERALRRGDFTNAEVWQRRALQNLREGVARHLADIREGEAGEGGSGGGGQESARGRVADGITDRTSDLTGETRSRAREILEQIRPRLEQADDSEERTYLERLLRRF